MQFLSEKLSRHLSSLVPGFEGHYYHMKHMDDVRCDEEIADMWRWDRVQKEEEDRADFDVFKKNQIICPAWQVEDVLRNLKEILPDPTPFQRLGFAEHLGRLLLSPSDTAYQKIEEYLWTILK